MAKTNSIIKLIRRAAKDQQKHLDLGNTGFVSLPPEIMNLTHLLGLDLGRNRLTSVPFEVMDLSNLTSLSLRSNLLTSVDPEITALKKLNNLNLSLNRLNSLPSAVTELTSLRSLNLSGNQLTTLPASIREMTNLSSLDISENNLTVFPLAITEMTNLTSINISGNGLTCLPPEINKLNKLSSLNVSNNPLRRVPSEVTKLNGLTKLFLRQIQLTAVPPEIMTLSKLVTFDIGGNRLTSLPTEITKLTNLVELHIDANGLTSFPLEITTLIKLTRLNISQNEMKRLPPEIIRLSKLVSLYLFGNQLQNLPTEISGLINLISLDVHDNQLKSVPPQITKLRKLTWLDLQGNQLPIPPETFSNPRRVKAIFASIAGLKTGERLNEAKMLVLGDGRVGKSSVVERLVFDTYNPRKETTLGVEISDEMNIIQYKAKGKGEAIKLNIWDFGGQEIQHSTHQFFLTTRSLYLLVLDARKGDQISNVEYWLKLIESFGGDSPILIAVNQIDQLKGQRALNLDRKALQRKYNIRGFIETSCETGEGIAQLKQAISSEVEQLKHVRDIWPREWFAIKERLKGIQDDYIPIEKYFEICSNEGVHDEELRHTLLGLLHDLGIVIRFAGDTEVLNPRWVTQGVYGILTSEHLVERQGQLELKDVGGILSGLTDSKSRYPLHTHRRLIDVMRHFELCFEFTDRPNHYLIPRHLRDNEPDIPWDELGALKFEYHYETLPDSIISRFIVRMNQYIQEQYYWKNGVILHSGENRAKIKTDLVDRKLFISILGKEQTRRAFLAIVRSAFNEINSNFKIEIKQMIPVPGSPNVLVSYEDLLTYEEMNEPQIIIPELKKKLSVRELLDGVEELSSRMERHERDVDLIMNGESEAVEFKSSLRTNLHTRSKDPKMELEVLKSLAAFLNTNGGTLFVGVSDDGGPVGIQVDEFENEDKMNLHLVNIVKSRLGISAMTSMLIHFDDHDDCRVMVVKCQKAHKPVFVRDAAIERFYIRTGASTTELSASQTHDYVKQRFDT